MTVDPVWIDTVLLESVSCCDAVIVILVSWINPVLLKSLYCGTVLVVRVSLTDTALLESVSCCDAVLSQFLGLIPYYLNQCLVLQC